MIWKILIIVDLILTLWCVWGVWELTGAVKYILMTLELRKRDEE